MSYLLVTGLLTFVGIVVLAAVVLVILSRRRRSAG
jgi:LPXTG-motif cell wall-anchored protein